MIIKPDLLHGKVQFPVNYHFIYSSYQSSRTSSNVSSFFLTSLNTFCISCSVKVFVSDDLLLCLMIYCYLKKISGVHSFLSHSQPVCVMNQCVSDTLFKMLNILSFEQIRFVELLPLHCWS